MRISQPSLAILSLILGGATLCSAGSIITPTTYDVGLTVGTAQVTGFVVTDGALGFLDSANILNWNLQLTDSVNGCPGLPCSYDLTGPDITVGNGGLLQEDVIQGSNLSATPTQLLFNFDATDASFFFFEAGGANDLLCVGAAGTCIVSGSLEPPGVEVIIGDPDTQTAILSGTQAIATAAAPEPSTSALLVAGITLIGLRKWRVNSGEIVKSL